MIFAAFRSEAINEIQKGKLNEKVDIVWNRWVKTKTDAKGYPIQELLKPKPKEKKNQLASASHRSEVKHWKLLPFHTLWVIENFKIKRI